MGQAKLKIEIFRKSVLSELENWVFDPTVWETRTVAEIQILPIVTVERAPNKTLEFMRMLPRQCHKNAKFMETNDPNGRMKHITGWWIQDDKYVLHSVVYHDGQYSCVTPALHERDSSFHFVPDFEIEWRDVGEYEVPYRNDVEIGPGIRTNPAKTLADIENIKRRLLSGMNPYDALKLGA